MGKRSASGITNNGGTAASASQPRAVATAAQANNANDSRFKPIDNSPYHDLYNGRQYYQDQTFNIDTRMAIQDYLSDRPSPGSIYSPSQDLNYKMRNGAALSTNEQFMVDALNDGMHNMGYNVNLTRYARVDYMEKLGVKNYDKLSESQLKNALVGKGYKDPAFGSYSYNNFANAPAKNPFTDKAVKIIRRTKASTQVLMPGNGPGGSLGEIVVAPNQGVHIVDVKYTGKRGRSGANYYRQVEIIVEDD